MASHEEKPTMNKSTEDCRCCESLEDSKATVNILLTPAQLLHRSGSVGLTRPAFVPFATAGIQVSN